MLGGWSISEELIESICKILPEGKTILELGSGKGTLELRKYFKVISIEHDPIYARKLDDTHLVYNIPLKEIKPTKEFPEAKEWYNPIFMSKGCYAPLPCPYDLLLVDGPIGKNRAGLWKYKNLFNWDVPVIFDDTNREYEWKLCTLIARHYKFPQILTLDSDTRPSFSVLADKETIKKLL